MTASGRGSLPNAEVKLDRANLDKILDKFDPENDLKDATALQKLGQELADHSAAEVLYQGAVRVGRH